MLILQRKLGQSLLIGDDIKISIVEISNDKVKIAIDAPKELKVIREELFEATSNNIEASTLNENSFSFIKSLIKKK